MGRLMLNVLLSFAQVEREVTGERIRDKIAASKARGMWMGGVPPLGYDLPAPGTRALRVKEEEAAKVRHTFHRHLKLGSVHALQRELDEQGIRSKQRITQAGKRVGGEPFSRGALFHLLRNRIYLGQIVHRDAVPKGEHQAILEEESFECVQRMLVANARRHRAALERRTTKAPLTGKLFDAEGEPMSPTFSRGKSGRSYRYYVSALLLQEQRSSDDGVFRRLPAPAIERVIGEALVRWLGPREHLLELILSARLVADGIAIELPAKCAAALALRLGPSERVLRETSTSICVHLPLTLPLRVGRRLIVPHARRIAAPDPKLMPPSGSRIV